MSRFVAAALVALAGLALTLPAAADQWKWRDASGRIVYSDRPPPPGIPDKAILQHPRGLLTQPVPPSPSGPSLVPGPVAVVGAPASAASGPKRTEPELEAKRRKEAEAKAAEQKASEAKVAAAKADNCSRARSQLKTLDDGVRIARTNANGEREILDDKGRADEQARMRSIMASDCS
jgi:hypothetical protein